jgi:hypothetical protein
MPKSKRTNKKQRVQLMDTRINFSMAIKLPTKDYKPKRKTLTKSEMNKRYRERHPDRVYQQNKKWRLNNKEKFNEIQRKWRNALPIEVKERCRKKNRERMRAYYRRKKQVRGKQ